MMSILKKKQIENIYFEYLKVYLNVFVKKVHIFVNKLLLKIE